MYSATPPTPRGLSAYSRAEPPMPTSPERRVFAHRANSTLSHRYTDSTSAIDLLPGAGGEPRTPERRPQLKARRSSSSNVLYVRGGGMANGGGHPPDSPPKKRLPTRRRLLQQVGPAVLFLLLCGFALYRDRLWRSSIEAAGGVEVGVEKQAKQPVVVLPPREPRPARNATHAHLELAKLQSTLAQPHSATVAAVIFCTDSTLVNLRPLLGSLERQTLAPTLAVVLCDVETDSSLSTPHLPVSLIPSALDTDSPRAILSLAADLLTDFLLILDADSPSLAQDHIDTLVHAAGTVEYSAAMLTTRGLAFHPASLPSCEPADAVEPLSSLIHLPSAPYLVQRTWLTPALESGLRIDLQHGHALALALWLKAGIGAYAVPLSDSTASPCPSVRIDPDLALAFLAERAMLDGEPRSSDEYMDRIARGVVAVVVGDAEELLAIAPLACQIAAGASATVIVYLKEGRIDEHLLPCYLEVKTGGVLDAAADDVVLYVSDRSVTAPELRAINAWTSGAKGRLVGKAGPTAIRVPMELVASLDWAGTLELESLRNWHRPRIDLAVITNNRPESLTRLLRSLLTAEYYGDEVQLSISLEQTADLATQRLIESFHWPHGSFTVRHRIILGGLMPAITEAWYPASNDTYGVFLEDDVELSPLFYGWVKMGVLKYRYGSERMSEQSRRLYGISLYQQKALELRPEGRRPFDAHILFDDLDLDPSTPYLSQIPCSWGAVYFPEVWREFHLYLALRLSEIALGIADVVVPDARSNRWPRSWKKYFVELVYARGYLMLYPNYPAWRSFSTNHLEAGTHIRNAADAKRRAQFEVPLAPRGVSLLEGLPMGRMPGWTSLPVLDLWGSVTSEDELVQRGWEAMQSLGVCPVRVDVPLGTFDARELLCERRKWREAG